MRALRVVVFGLMVAGIFAGTVALLPWGAPSHAAPSASTLPLDPPATAGAMAPQIAVAGDGSLWLTWLEPRRPSLGGGHRLRLSHLVGNHWSTPTTIVEGTDFFANWADVPGVGIVGRRMVAHWLAKSGADKYAYEVRLARSEDGGRSFRPAGVLHADKKPAEHGFVSWLRDGKELRAVWLDGRKTPDGGAMQVRTAALSAGGPANEVELDARVCDCCATAAVETALGPLVMYRDRSEGEIRDHSIVRWQAGRWTAPQPLGAEGWKIEGCPVNGPALAASGHQVAAAWFSAAPAPRLRFAMSKDAGATFSAPVDLDTEAPIGRLSLTLDADGSAVASWLASGGEGKARLRLRRVLPNGRLGAPLDLATTTSARASGVPRIARVADHLLVVWIEGGAVQKLRALWVPTSQVPRPN